MLYHNVRVMAHYMRPLDAMMVGLTSLGVWSVGRERGLWAGSPTPALVFAGAMALGFFWLAGRFHLYHAWRTEQIRPELQAFFQVLLHATAMSCLAVEVLSAGLPGPVYAATLVAAGIGLLGTRAVMRLGIRRLRRVGKDYRVWLIVGCNKRAARIVEEVLANPHFGVRIAGVVEVMPGQAGEPSESARRDLEPLRGLPRIEVGEIEAIRQVIASQIVDELVVTLPLRTHYDHVARLLKLSAEAGVSVKLSTETFDRSWTKTELSPLGTIPLVTYFSGPSQAGAFMAKRAIDVLFAAAALLVLSPLLAALALWTKLGSRGGVLFVQTRVGLHGRQFRMLKLRTMVRDAHLRQGGLAVLNETDGAAFKIREDPRVVRGGRFLRKYHLDELPQLWNVLVGDMSLVGPRPLPPSEAPGQEWWQRRRLSMPPGLTCLWQAEGEHKHTMPFKRWMELDLRYIDQWSLGLDFNIMLRTLLVLPRGAGW